MKNVVLWLLAMMMESVSNIAIERNARFSFMMENPNINATDRNVGFAFKVV